MAIFTDQSQAQLLPGKQVMVQQWEVIEVEIDGRTQEVRPGGSWVLDSGNLVPDAVAVSLDKPLEWATGCS